MEFQFPEFASERARIKAYSQRFKNLDLAQSFEAVYGTEVCDPRNFVTADGHKTYAEPRVAKVGEIYFGTITSMNNRGCDIENENFNETFRTKENLTQYPGLQSYLLNNANQVWFKVKKAATPSNPVVEVNVLEAYYDKWAADIMTMAENKQPFEVKNLALLPGGFIGKIDIPYLTQMLGVPFYLDAFIPGSQIALNVERDFTKWQGADVTVLPKKFVVNKGQTSLLCSRKDYLMDIGNNNLARMYAFRENPGIYNKKYDGVVTGIINTNQKCGVFVELPEEQITGLVPCKPFELVNYRPGTPVRVKIAQFEVRENKKPIVYKRFEVPAEKRKKGKPRYEESDIIEFVNVKPIFEFA